MFSFVLYLIIMVNPFAVFLYLDPVRDKFTKKEFFTIIAKATLISLFISLLFFYLGNTLIHDVFKIDFDSFRIFAGIIMFSFSYIFIIKWKKWYIEVRSKSEDIAPKIALPFMVWAGTMSLSLLFSQELSNREGLWIFTTAFALVFIALAFLTFVRMVLTHRHIKTFFDRMLEILLRINGFFVWSIWVYMIITSIKNIFFK